MLANIIRPISAACAPLRVVRLRIVTNDKCIGCGICVSVCPMDVLSFTTTSDSKLVQISPAGAV